MCGKGRQGRGIGSSADSVGGLVRAKGEGLFTSFCNQGGIPGKSDRISKEVDNNRSNPID